MKRSLDATRELICRSFLLLLFAVLTSCGGGGGGGGNGPAPVGITVQPADQSVLVGAQATFSVGTTGQVTGYQWQTNAAGSAVWTDIVGAPNASYTVTANSTSLTGQRYRVVVTGPSNSVVSSTATLTVTQALTAPSVTVAPADVSVTAGADAIFHVTAAGTALGYHWQSSADNLAWTDIAGQQTDTLVLAKVTIEDSGKHFRAVVENGAGSVASASALLTVAATPVTPSFTMQPGSLAVVVPQSAIFSVAVAGTPAPQVQWQISTNGGATYSDIPQATSTSYTTPATAIGDSGSRFRATATSSSGSATSSAAILTVSAAPAAPAITVQPVSATVTVPATATFTVTATGAPAPGLQWQVSTDGGATFANVVGATSTSYTTPATSAADDGKRFRAVATNVSGSATSSSAILNVSLAPSAPALLSQPANVSVVAPVTATFSVSASGVPTPTYQWQISTDAGATYANIPGAASASYTTPATALADSGNRYRAVATNASGSATSVAGVLTVSPTPAAPSIPFAPADANVTAPATATFTVTATGTPSPSLQWQVSSDAGLTFTDIAGANAAGYTTQATSANDDGKRFRVVATNSVGSATSAVAILSVRQVPAFNLQPASLSVTAPASATFTVAAGGLPAPTYQWQRSTDAGSTYTNIAGATAASYTTPATSLLDSGNRFRAVATNAAGAATSASALLTVSAAPVAPSIAYQPADVRVTAPATASFTVGYTGTATVSVQWQISTNGGVTFTNLAGATGITYTTPATSVTDDGKRFRAVATNAWGSATSSAALLNVDPTPAAPVITSQPSSASVTAPATATFSVSASGVPSPTYQWQFSTDAGSTFTDIAGATSATFQTPATSPLDSGNRYRAVANNGSGSSISAAATLTVTPAPVAPSIAYQPADAGVTEPATATFTATATGTPAPTLQWQLSTDGGVSFVNVAGATSSSYTTPATTPADDGKRLRLVATNASGSATSNAARLTVTPASPAPYITQQPASVRVTVPEAGTFTVRAVGTPAPAYQWQISTGSAFSDIAGATSATYTTPPTTDWSQTRYRVIASNSAGTATSNTVTLFADPSPLAPTCSLAAAPANIKIGESATLTASCSPAATSFSWVSPRSVDGWRTELYGSGSTAVFYPAATGSVTIKVIGKNAYGGNASSTATATINIAGALPGAAWTVRNSNPSMNSVAWSGTGFVAVGGTGAVRRSSDGVAWSVPSFITVKGLNAVIWTGSAFIAVGGGQGGGEIWTSADGFSWVRRATASCALNGVTSSGTRLVAVGSCGAISSSSDGTTWTSETSGTSDVLKEVVWTGAQFVTLGSAGTLLTSPDGSAWTQRTFPVASTGIASGLSWSGSLLVASTGLNVVTSTDGIAWTSRASGLSSTITKLKRLNGQFVGIACGQFDCFFGLQPSVVTSSDGLTWQAQATGLAGNPKDIAWSGTRYVLVGSDRTFSASTTDSTTIQSSVDLSFTSKADLGPGQHLYGVAANSTTAVAVGAAGTVVRSTDGVVWSPNAPSFTAVDLWDVATIGSNFLAVGNAGTAATSPDGLTWTTRTTGSSASLKSVAWSGSLIVAVGSGGEILSSADAVTWTHGASGTAGTINRVLWDGIRFVAVGTGGYIATSTDGITWLKQTSGTTSDLGGVAWSGSTFVVAGGSNAVTWTSPDAVAWTSHVTSGGGGTAQWDVAWTGSLFVLSTNWNNDAWVLSTTDGFNLTLQLQLSNTWFYRTAQTPWGFVSVGANGAIITSQ